MKTINSLSGQLMEELSDLLNAETQLLKALPEMVEASQSLTLKALLEDHWEDTKLQADSIRHIFSYTGQHPAKAASKIIKKLIKESGKVVNKTGKSQTRDAAIIDVVHRIKQYEISEYQSAWHLAAQLGSTGIMELLDKTLKDERVMNLHLNEMTQERINAESMQPAVK